MKKILLPLLLSVFLLSLPNSTDATDATKQETETVVIAKTQEPNQSLTWKYTVLATWIVGTLLVLGLSGLGVWGTYEKTGSNQGISDWGPPLLITGVATFYFVFLCAHCVQLVRKIKQHPAKPKQEIQKQQV